MTLLKIILGLLCGLVVGRKPSEPRPDTEPVKPFTREELKREIIASGQSEYRLLCADIAADLQGRWGFVVKTIGTAVLIVATAAGVVVGLWGKGIESLLTSKAEEMEAAVMEKLDSKVTEIGKHIERQFEADNIQVIIRDTAAAQANVLLKDSVQPSIDNFVKTLRSSSDAVMEKQEKIDQTLKDLEMQLGELSARNVIAGLVDKIVADADVKAYRELAEMVEEGTSDAIKLAARAELHSLRNSLLLMPPLTPSGQIDVSRLKTSATNDLELTKEQLIAILAENIDHEEAAAVRLRAVYLLMLKTNPHSFEEVSIIIDVLEREDNILNIRYIQDEVRNKTGINLPTGFDSLPSVKWWKERERQIRQHMLETSMGPPAPEKR